MRFPSTKHSQRTSQGQETLTGSPALLGGELLVWGAGLSRDSTHLSDAHRDLVGGTEGCKLNLSTGLEPTVGIWPFPSDFRESPGTCLALAKSWHRNSRSQLASSEGQAGDKGGCAGEGHGGAHLAHWLNVGEILAVHLFNDFLRVF